MPWTSDLRSQETLPAIVNRMAKADPHKEFLRTVDGASATWEQLQEAMILWAARFLALEVKKGDVVVTLLDAGLDSLAAWLGLSSIGATDAATNPEFRGRMLAYAINNCRPALIIVAAQYLPFLEAVAAELQTVKRVLVLDADPRDLAQRVAVAWPDAAAHNSPGHRRSTAGGCVSLGCTKSPALHIHPAPQDLPKQSSCHGDSCTRSTWGRSHSRTLRPSDIFYCTTSHAHFGSKSIPYHAAMAGGQVVIRSRFALNSFWQDVSEFGITTGMLVGSMADCC